MSLRKWIYKLPLIWKSLFRRRDTDGDLDDELAFHIQMQTEANRQRGMSEAEARYAALRQFDGLQQRKEECRDMRQTNWIEESAGDIAYAIRSLRSRPGFCALGVLSLAIGIGANTALFSVVDAVVLHPVPLRDAHRLVAVDEFKDGKSSNGNPPRTADWGATVPAFEAVTGFYSEDAVLTGAGEPAKIATLRTCGDPLATLGVNPQLGRGFTAAERSGAGDPAALIADELWRERFSADRAVAGRLITLGGKSYTIVGVLPAGLAYPSQTLVWTPMPRDIQQVDRRAGFLRTVARLGAGVTRTAAASELNVAVAQLAQRYPATDRQRSAALVSLNDLESRESRGPLLILLATALAVLLLACVNFASLLLSRGLARQREASIRLALGAGTGRLVRLYLSESLVVAVIGGLAGVAAASWTLSLLVSMLPPDLPNLESVSLNGRVLLAAAAMTLISGLAAGWAPARRVAGSASIEGLRARISTEGRESRWLQKTLLAGQVALSVLLLTGAVLLTQSLVRLGSEPLGFQPEHVLTVNIGMPWDTPEVQLNHFSKAAIERFAAIPGVRAAGMIDRLPLKGGTQGGTFSIRNRPATDGRPDAEVSLRAMAGNYFGAAGVQLLAGRDVQEGARELVVNQAFAAAYFADHSPLGQALRINGAKDKAGVPRWSEIVGVVADVRQEPSQKPTPEIYLAASDTYWPRQVYVVRAAGDPMQMVAAVRQAVREIDPAKVIDSFAAMEQTVHGATAQPRLRARVFGGFAAIALLLTALGIYGLQSQTVTQRTKEIGIRLALGETPMAVARRILTENLQVVAIGLILGAAASALLTSFLTSLLYGVSPLDPAAFALAALGLAIVTAAASFLPARHAAGVAPLTALRND